MGGGSVALDVVETGGVEKADRNRRRSRAADIACEVSSRPTPGAMRRQATRKLLADQSLKMSTVAGVISAKNKMHNLIAPKAAPPSETKLGKKDMHPQEKLAAFIDEFEAEHASDLQKERQGLVAVFMGRRMAKADEEAKGSSPPGFRYSRRASGINPKTIQQVQARRRSTTRNNLIVAESTESAELRNLITQLSRASKRLEVAAQVGGLSELEISQTVASLQVLITMVYQHGDDLERKRRQQQLLNLLGAPTVALVMASCEQDELCKQGLLLGIALLDGGNADVQEAIFLKLTDPAQEELLRPFDGSSHTFISMMRLRLRIAMREVTERKTFYEVRG